MSGTEFDALRQQIQHAVAAQGFTRLVGARLQSLEPGQCLVEVDARPELLQHYGYFHGGVSAYLIDNASAIAAATIAPGVSRPVTSEFKVNFLAPTKGAKLSCHARVVKSGRTLVIVAADIHAQTDDHNTHVATALATVFMT